MFSVSNKQLAASRQRASRISRAVVLGLIVANMCLVIGFTATVHASPLHDGLMQAFTGPGTAEKLALMLAAPQATAPSHAALFHWSTIAAMIVALASMSAGSIALSRSLKRDLSKNR